MIVPPGYMYFPKSDKYYSHNLGDTSGGLLKWEDAPKKCNAEGAKLFEPRAQSDHDAISLINRKFKF